MKNLILIGIIILLSSCSTSKPYKHETMASDFPTHELIADRSISEIREIIENEPYNGFFMEESSFKAPYDDNKSMMVLEYYFNKRVWMVFDDKGQLVTYGDGMEKEAEFLTYKFYYDYLVGQDKMKESVAEKLTFTKYKEFYDTTSLEDEYFLYRIMLKEKVENGTMEETEAEYLMTKKSNEIRERVNLNKYRKSRLNMQSKQISSANKQLFIDLLTHGKVGWYWLLKD